jgi:hypothetical protein
MKHIGWCLDQIQIAMMGLPKPIDSQEAKDKANEILNEVEGYKNTLVQLIEHPKFKEYLHNLEGVKIEEVSLEAAHIEQLAKDLETMAYSFETYLIEIRELIESHSSGRWFKMKIRIIVLMHLLNKNKRKLSSEYTSLTRLKALYMRLLNPFNNKADKIVHAIHQTFGTEKCELRGEFKIPLYPEVELRRTISSQEHLAEFLRLD